LHSLKFIFHWLMYLIISCIAMVHYYLNNLSSLKQGSLLCFVCHTEISQTTMFHDMLLVSLESSLMSWVHQLGLRLFGATVWKHLIIKKLFQWKLNKIKIEKCIKIWGCSWCYWKALNNSDFNIVYFTIFIAKVWKIFIFEWILFWKLKIFKNGVWKEKWVQPSMCSHCWILKFEILRMWKVKIVFTFWRTAQTTLVIIVCK